MSMSETPETTENTLLYRVKDPERVSSDNWMSSHHWEYRIEVKKSEDHAAHIEVMRRYKEFNWLRDRLEEAHPGVIVPPLPPKSVAAKLEQVPLGVKVNRLVAYRQRALERFLNRVGTHELLKDDKYFKVFIESQNLEKEPLFNEKVESLEKRYGLGMKSMFSKLKGGKKDKSPEPTWMDVVFEYADAYEMQLEDMRDAMGSLFKLHSEMGVRYREIGEVSAHCGSLDRGRRAEELIAADALDDFSTRTQQISTVYQMASGEEVVDMIAFYIEAFKGVKRVVKGVNDYENLLDLATSATNSCREKIAQLVSKNAGGKDDSKIAKLNDELVKLELRETELRTIHEQAEATLKKEWESFLAKKASDLKSILTTFHDGMAELRKKADDVWDGINNTLSVIPDA